MPTKPPRPSPSAHAADHKDAVRKGNDGHRYRSVADANGVYRWRKIAAGAPSKTGTAKAAGRTKRDAPRSAVAGGATVSRKASLAAKKQAEAKLVKEIEAVGAGKGRDRIVAAAWPCVRASYRVPGRAKVPTGTSRVGGLPDVPEGFVWPTATRAGAKVPKKLKKTASRFSLSFLGQINCADVAPFEPGSPTTRSARSARACRKMTPGSPRSTATRRATSPTIRQVTRPFSWACSTARSTRPTCARGGSRRPGDTRKAGTAGRKSSCASGVVVRTSYRSCRGPRRRVARTQRSHATTQGRPAQ